MNDITLTNPANHPANSPLTGERIKRVIEALESFLQYRNGSTLDHFIADAVKGMRELREVRKANGEPAMYCSAETIAAAKDGEHLLRTLSSPSGECVIPLYTAPPAPAVPEEKRDDDGNTTSEFDHGWNAFRAAMLQAGNSPVTPDGWIPVSERMPENATGVLVASPWQCAPGGYAMKWAVICPGHPDADSEGWIIPGASWSPTHWHPLPAAPQQDVKSALEHGMQRYSGAMQKLSGGDK